MTPEVVEALRERLKTCVRRHERLKKRAETVAMTTGDRLMAANYGQLAGAYTIVLRDAEKFPGVLTGQAPHPYTPHKI